MRYVIADMGHVTGFGAEGDDIYWFRVEYYERGDGNTPSRVNDHFIQLRDEVEVLDDAGRTVVKRRDVASEIDAAVRRYWDDAERHGFPADHTGPAEQRRVTGRDPAKVLARADVRAMKGIKR